MYAFDFDALALGPRDDAGVLFFEIVLVKLCSSHSIGRMS